MQTQMVHSHPSRSPRLKRRRLIEALFDATRTDIRSAGSGLIRILYRTVPAEEAGAGPLVRYSVAVGRRAGTAVRRNRIKRIMRQTWQDHRDLFDYGQFSDGQVLTMMIMLRSARGTGPDRRIRSDVTQAMHQMAEDLHHSGLDDLDSVEP